MTLLKKIKIEKITTEDINELCIIKTLTKLLYGSEKAL